MLNNMRRALLLLLLALPLAAELPAGVTRVTLSYPVHMASLVATPNDELWAADLMDEGKFARIALDGTTTTMSMPSNWQTMGATMGPDGALWLKGIGWVGRVDLETHAKRQWAIVTGGLGILAGPDGNLWFGSAGQRVAVMRPDGNLLATYPAGGTVTAGVFGPDGALYLLVASNLVRMTVTGETTEFPVVTSEAGLFAGPTFLWNAGRGYGEPGERAPGATIHKISLTGETLAVFTLDMEPQNVDALGNLWLRSTDADGNDIVGQLAPSGVLTRFGPIPASGSSECHPRFYGGMTFLSDGRVAMADYYPRFARNLLSPCLRSQRPAGFDNTVTILDPNVAPILSIDPLTRTQRRRSSRQ